LGEFFYGKNVVAPKPEKSLQMCVGGRGSQKLIGAVCFGHQWKKTNLLSCHRCLINTGVEKMNI